MNRIYRSIWNQATGAYAAVSENVKSAGKRSMPGSSGGGAHFALTSMAAALMLGYGSLALAGPTGGTVVAGQATINGAPGSTVIKQGSQNAVINWTQFNIGKGESVQFVQPNSNAVALNRVLGSDGTTILGNLSANGKVFIVNPNGILFGQGASVNTAGLVASTLDISNGDFMAGKYQFSGNGTGKVLNQGNINAPGGYVALLGANVSNEGTITARLGSVALAAGRAITLDVAGDGLLNVTVDRGAVGALVNNGGLIQADGGSVLLSAQAAGDLLKTVVNNTGIIEAHTIDTRSGTIKLLGDMQSGTVSAAGTLDASAPTGGNGGFIDTSAAHVKLDDALKVTTNAPHGLTGTWLIDPTDYTIAATGGDQTGAFFTNALKSSAVQIQSISGGSGVLGDINVNDTISWSANQLKMTAQNNININKPLRGSGTASLALEYGQQAVAAGNTSVYNVKAEIDLPSGLNFSTKLGSDATAVNYTVINSLGAATSTSGTDLQGLKNALTGNFVLGANIDASGTANTAVWGANGFTPIGSTATPFTGQFDGLGHVITGLNSSTTSAGGAAGLFGSNTGSIRNIGIVAPVISANIAGAAGNIAALAASNSGTISNAYVSGGSVTVANGAIGAGLVGLNSGTISDSYNSSKVSVTGNYDFWLGGLVGNTTKISTIINSYNSGEVVGAYTAGGLAGNNLGNITNSFNSGNVTGTTNSGGLTSHNRNTGVITNSFNTGAVTSNSLTGGLVGNNVSSGQIINSYSTGAVSSRSLTASGIGGLVGGNAGIIRNSYATGAVTGVTAVGGLIGSNTSAGLTENAYSSGAVSLRAGGSGNVGGLIGSIAAGTSPSITGGYYNTTVNPGSPGVGNNGGTTTPAITGLTASQMQVASNFGAFAFTTTTGATGNNWVMVNTDGTLNGAGNATGATGPMLAAEYSTNIYSSHQLQLMAMNLAGNYTLKQDINAASTGTSSDVWNGGTFVPVGASNASDATRFTGTFDGTGHVISGLVINRPGSSYAGLFGATGSTAIVRNVGLEGGSVIGSNSSGGLVGLNLGLVDGSYSTVSVTGGSQVGGLVGLNGTNGGVPGVISNSYASGAVTGTGIIGGLVGTNSGTLTNNYSSGAVTGGNTPGGLTGSSNGSATGNFWDTTTSGMATSGAGTGLSTAQMKLLANYTGQGWNLASTWIVYDTNTYPLLRAFMTPLQVTFASNASKTYDGTSSWTVPGVTYSNPNVVLQGSLNYGAAASAVNAGTYAITAGGLYSGQRGYAISSNAASLIITPKALTVTGVTAAARTYDGTTGVVISGGALSGLVGTETLTLSGLSGSYADKNAGSAKAVTVTGAALSDAGSGVTAGLASNYMVTNPTGVTGMVSTASITSVSGLTAGNRVYDGTNIATLGGTAIINGMITGDNLVFSSATGTFTDKNVGNGKTVNISGIMLGGSDLVNYNFSNTSAATTASITPKALTVTGVAAANKVYDGSTAATLAGGALNGLVGKETLSLGVLSGTFGDQNVGNSKVVTVTGVTLADAGSGSTAGRASNYTISNPLGVTANITPKALTVTGVTAADKVYDGTATATLSGGALSGLVGTETLNMGTLAGVFGDKNAANGKAVTVSGAALGDAGAGATAGLASNYTVSNPAGVVANISQKVLTVSGMTAGDKVYDGNTKASLSGGTLAGLVGSETLNFSGQSGVFDDKNAASGKTVTVSGATLADAGSGASAGLASNYTVSNPTGLLASIAQKALTITGTTAANRVYDGTTAVTISGGGLDSSGFVGTETVSLSGLSGAFADKNVGTAKAVTVSGAALNNGSNGGLASNYTVASPSGLVANVSKATISSVSNIVTDSKVYDGNTKATVSATTATFNGMASGDNLSFSASSALFSDKNVGSKTTTVSGVTLGGADATNYTLTTSSGTGTGSITPKAVTIINMTAVNKVYDGTTKASVSGGAISGTVGSETLGATGLVATFDDKNAGTGKTVTSTGTTLVNGTGGGLASNYTVTNPTFTANITPKALTISGMTAGSKVYDGLLAASLSGGALSGLVTGETLVLTGGTGVFGDKNVGTAKAVTVSGVSVANGTGLASNYSVTNPTTVTGSVTPKAVTIINMTAVNKVYDGSTKASVTGGAISGTVGSETLGATGLVAVFDDKNAGTGKTVTSTGTTLVNGTGGGLASNYTVTNPTFTANITPKALTVSGMTAGNKVYDGLLAASLSGGTLNGLVNGETLGMSGGMGVFGDKNVGNGKAVAVNGVSLGDGTGLASNYTVSNPSNLIASITPKALTVTGVTAGNKTYDGSRAAALSGGALDGLVGTETLLLSGQSGVFNDKNAGTGKDVTVSGATLADAGSGATAGLARNYTVSNVTGLKADIAQKELTVGGITAANKVYDGKTGATLDTSGATFAGMVADDSLTASASGAFGDKNAATGKTVNITGIALGGTDAANYTLASNTASTRADISKAQINAVAGITAGNKVYDGKTDATLDTSAATFAGMVADDSLTASASGAFGDKNAATGKTVNITGIALGGTDAANYTLASNTASTRADISKAQISAVAGITAGNKVYDGKTGATLDTSAATFAGMVADDSLTASASGAFGDKNAAAGKTVNIAGIALGGTDAGNYILASNTASARADISKAQITAVAGITAGNKVYDGKTGATLDTSAATFAGMVADDSLTASASGAFGDKNAATGKTVNIAGIALGGTDAGNYMLASNTASAKADISKAQITAVGGITAGNKVYDGKTGATLDTSGATFAGMVADDSLTASAIGAFGDKNAATGKTVNIEGIALGGVDAGNYILASNTASARADISKAQISAVAGITAGNKVYDGKTGATLDTSGATFAGMVADDSLTASASGAFGDKNAATGKTVNIAGIVLGGADAGNYMLASNTASAKADISKAQITAVGGITAGNKVYDGKTGATLDTSAATFAGMVADDSLTASAIGAFGDKNAAAGKTVNIAGIALGGTDAGNYMLASDTASAKADIAAKALTLSDQFAASKVYDGNANASLSGGVLNGLVAGETLAIGGQTALFNDKNAASGKAVTVTGTTLVDGTGLASNYSVSDPTGMTASITQKALTVAGQVAGNKVYDGNVVAQVSGGSLVGLVGDETLSMAGQTATFADKNAGNAKAVTVSGTVLVDGTGLASNYSVSDPTGLTASIAQKALTVAGQVAGNKVYDGNVVAQVSGGSLVGLVGSETLTIASQSAAFGDKNAGSAKTVTVSGTTLLDGSGSASNYTVSNPTGLTANITPATIRGVSGIVAAGKVYDGNNKASLNLAGATFDGMVVGDALALGNGTVSGAFSDKNAAAGKAVLVSGLGLGGQDAANYVLASNTATTTADINRASLLVSATAANRVYDATTGASVTLSDNRIGNDQLSIATSGASFSDKNAGTGKTVTVGGIAISGADAANYVVNGTASAKANIAQAALTVKVDNAEKDQGRINPAFNASYAGLLGGDTVAGELNGNLAFATAATTGSVAGNYVVSASGQASGNYALSYVDGVLKVNPTAALQSAVANVIAAVNVAPSQGNMVQADLIASGEAAPGKGAATPEAQREGEHDGTGASGAPVVQLAGNVVNNVLPGLRLSVVDSGLRLPTEAGGTHQESQ